MEYIHRLPLISSSFAAIIIGLVNYKLGASNQDTYLRIAVGIIVFFLLGLYARNFAVKIYEDVNKRLEKDINLEKAANKEKIHEDMKPKKNSDAMENDGKGRNLDFIAGDDEDFKPLGEDFKPLEVSKAIKSKLRE